MLETLAKHGGDKCHSLHSRVPLKWMKVCGLSIGLVLLMCLMPSQNARPRSLSTVQEMQSKGVRGGIEAALIDQQPRAPEIVSYPDANVTTPSKHNRPYFILHVGPPKTATTTLQTEMTKYGPALKLDNYAYLGQIMRSSKSIYDHWHGKMLRILKDRECQQAVSQARWRNEEWPVCWERFLDLLQERRDEGRSVIFSEEDFAIKYGHLAEDIGRAAIDWPSLRMALYGQGWEPIVIVGYRRLYDIMPSAKQQWDQWTKNNDGLVHWPPWGRVLQPLFPGVLKDPRLYDDYVPKYIPRTIQWSYTDHLVNSISPYLPVRLLNMHDDLSIRSTFLCRVLPHAPNACRQSQLDDAEKGELHSNKESSLLFYDAITTEAADRGWFEKKKFDRHQVGLALRDYHEKERGGSTRDFPVICPNSTQLEILLERSLVKERQILSREVADSMRDEHIAGFYTAVEKSKFCWIDVEKTLEDAHWKQFFSEIISSEESNDTGYDNEPGAKNHDDEESEEER